MASVRVYVRVCVRACASYSEHSSSKLEAHVFSIEALHHLCGEMPLFVAAGPSLISSTHIDSLDLLCSCVRLTQCVCSISSNSRHSSSSTISRRRSGASSMSSSLRCSWMRCGVGYRCSAVQCGAVRCGAVRCGAVRCGAVRCGEMRCGEMLSAIQSYQPTIMTQPYDHGALLQVDVTLTDTKPPTLRTPPYPTLPHLTHLTPNEGLALDWKARFLSLINRLVVPCGY